MSTTLRQMMARTKELANHFDEMSMRYDDSKSLSEKYVKLNEKMMIAHNYIWEADVLLNPGHYNTSETTKINGANNNE